MRRTTLAAFAALAGGVANGAANGVFELPAVVVEASRFGRSKAEMASQVDVLTRADVESSGASSTAALLERRANVHFRSSGTPAMAQVSMRGGGANGFGRVKILVDGEDLNNPDMAAQDLMRVPVRSVERVEVLHGPQTVLYGSDASAGVVNVVSDADDYERKTTLEAHAGNLGAAGGHAGTRGGSEPDGVTYWASADYDRSDGWRDNAQSEFWSAKGGVKQRFGNGSWAALKAFYSNSSYGLPGGLYADSGGGGWKKRARSADDRSSHARNDVYGFSVSANGVVDDENAVEGSLSFRNRNSRSYGNLEYDVYGFAASLKASNDARRFGLENRFDAGVDLKDDLLFGDSSQPGSAGGENDYNRFSAALFARDELAVLETLSVFAGARGEGICSRDRYDGDFRYDYGAATYRREEGASGKASSAVAAEAGVLWRPAETVKAFAKWSRFYHAPLADELFSAYAIPNMELEPERGDNVETGFDWTFCGEFNAALAVFHSLVDDEILYQNGGNVNAPDRVRRCGAEASFTWSRKNVGSAGLLCTLNRARFSEGPHIGNDVPLVPAQLARAYGEWFLADWLSVRGGVRFVGEQRHGGDFANAGGKLPCATLFDCGLRVMPGWEAAKGLSFSFDVDNLFDRRYASYGEYFGSWYVYPGNGRAFLFSVRCDF